MDEKRVLCIDDDQHILDLLGEELRDHGYIVRCLADSMDAFTVIQSFTPNLIICDVTIPVLSGFELLERVRSRTDHISSIPFIFLSALSDRADVIKGRRLGADDYLTKPIDFVTSQKSLEAA